MILQFETIADAVEYRSDAYDHVRITKVTDGNKATR